MLKITVENHDKPLTLCLAGKLAGPWVNELRSTWISLCNKYPEKTIVVDLSQVIFVDSNGKQLLALMLDQGADFQNAQLLTRYIVEELKSARTN
jgi:anti-anti-sigma regulatory factor